MILFPLFLKLSFRKIDDNGQFLKIYDPTCGGANLLFGVEDKIKNVYQRPTATYGQEWNDALYALAKIESRFREDSDIRYGNTLTARLFDDIGFDVVVANPPYGIDWKGYQKDIKDDETGRFVALPSISDGQFLFTQHIISYLGQKGMAIVVHNGSTLFSGDAGSGESAIRKHFFEKDYVEAIIQMPTDEFFNTGIYTYLWIFNKNKPAERKDKVILINASELFVPLKKSKGKKRKEMSIENRKEILSAFTHFEDNEFAKVFDKWNFYYNKQAIVLTNVDENGKAIQMPIKKNKQDEEIQAKSIKLNPLLITQDATHEDIENGFEDIELDEFVIADNAEYKNDLHKLYEEGNYKNLLHFYTVKLKPFISLFNYKEKNLKIYVNAKTTTIYYYDKEKETIIKETYQDKKPPIIEELGNGKINLKASYKKATKTKAASITVSVELTQDLQKDYEIIPYSPDETQNNKQISEFMAKYVSKPFEYAENTIGVEINFNKVFYKPQTLKPIEEIKNHLQTLEQELKELEQRLNA